MTLRAHSDVTYLIPGYDECGWAQMGLPDCGGIGFGALFTGIIGARAAFR